jgi:hypothetical protein
MWLKYLNLIAGILALVGVLSAKVGFQIRQGTQAGVPTEVSAWVRICGVALGFLIPAEPIIPIKVEELVQAKAPMGNEGSQSVSVVDQELVKLLPDSIVKMIPVSKDCMILSYLPVWNHGELETFGLANIDGGVRIMVGWPEIPAREALLPDRQFMVVLYSHKTTSNLPPGFILAFEFVENWGERTSWQERPAYDPEPVGTYKFERGEG